MAEFVKKVQQHLDLDHNQLINVAVESRSSHPLQPKRVGEVYFNTTENKFAYCVSLDPVTWEYAESLSAITAKLALKQDKLIAGANITIDENNIISADRPKASVFVKNFDVGDFTDGVLTILESEHGLGKEVCLKYIRTDPDADGFSYEPIVDFAKNDTTGAVKIITSSGFKGSVMLIAYYENAAEVENSLQNILYGSVSE